MSDFATLTGSIPVITQTIPVVTQPIHVIDERQARRPVTAWRNAVFAVFGITGLTTAAWVSRIPEVRDQLSVGTSGMAVLLAGLSVGSIIGLVCAPRAIARLGSRRMMSVALPAAAVALLAVGLAVDVAHSMLLTCAALVALGFSLSSTSVTMNLDATVVERRTARTIMPMMHACFSAGTIVGALLGALAAALGVSMLVFAALMGVVVAAGAAGALHSVPHRDDGLRRESAVGRQDALGGARASTEATAVTARSVPLWRDGRLLLIGVMMVGMSFVEGSANDWLSLAAVDGHGMSNTTGALVYTLFVLSMTAGRVVGGPIVDRFGRQRTLVAVASIAVVGLVLFMTALTPAMAFVGVVLWGFGASLGFPVGMTLAADHPTDAARRVSLVSVFGYSASLVGPPLLGVLGEHVGILHAFVLVLGFVVVSLVAIPFTRERRVAPQRVCSSM